METRVETISGNYAPADALKISDLPFPKGTANLWISADSITSDSAGIKSFVGLLGNAAYARSTSDAPAKSMTASGIQYARGLGAGSFAGPNVIGADAETRTLFAVCRPPASTPGSTASVFTAYTSAGQSVLGLDVLSTTSYRLVVRTKSSSNSAANIVPITVPESKWFGLIATADAVNQRITVEVVDQSKTLAAGLTDGGGKFTAAASGKSEIMKTTISDVAVLGTMSGADMSLSGYKLLRDYLRNRISILSA